jgi:hypothetical protein
MNKDQPKDSNQFIFEKGSPQISKPRFTIQDKDNKPILPALNKKLQATPCPNQKESPKNQNEQTRSKFRMSLNKRKLAFSVFPIGQSRPGHFQQVTA